MAADDPAALCAAILAEGRRRAEQIREAARRQGAATLEQAEREAARVRGEAEEAARREARRRLERARAGEAIALGRLRADRVEALLASLRDRARRALTTLSPAATHAAVCALASDALRRMEGERFVLTVRPGADGDEGLAEEVLRRADLDRIALTLEADPAVGEPGFLLRDAEGRQEWDGRLGARLDRLWPALRVPLAQAVGLLEAEGRAP